jgi:hypothetical protein
VNGADTAHLADRDGHVRLGDRIHVGQDDGTASSIACVKGERDEMSRRDETPERRGRMRTSSYARPSIGWDMLEG